MSRRNGLKPGWRLFKPKADALTRRASLEIAADQLNQSVEVPSSFGTFSVVPCRDDLEYRRSYGQVGATAASDPLGFQLRATLRFRDRRPAFAPNSERAEDEMREMRNTLEEIGALDIEAAAHTAVLVNSIVERAIAPSAQLADPVRMVGLGGCPTPLGWQLYVTVDLMTVGPDLQFGIDRVSSVEIGRLEADLARCVAHHLRLESIRRTAAAAGIVGWIDGTATRILDASGLELPSLIERLRRTSFVQLSGTIGDRPRLQVELRWQDGIVSGTLRRQQDGVNYSRGLLKMNPFRAPETIMMALPGRRLDALLTHPLVPTDAIITDIREHWDGLHVTVDEEVTPITTGMLQTGWSEPRT